MSPADIISLRPKSEGSEIVSRHMGARCLGPAAGWPDGCAKEFGHEGDHQRMDDYIYAGLQELKDGISRIKGERADLLESLKDVLDHIEDEHGCEAPCIERARAVIALTESR